MGPARLTGLDGFEMFTLKHRAGLVDPQQLGLARPIQTVETERGVRCAAAHLDNYPGFERRCR